jgi:hypothetical protein
MGVLALPLLAAPAPGQETIDLRGSELPRWSLEEDFRLGSVDGEHPTLAPFRPDG